MRIREPPEPLPDPPDHLADLVAALLRGGFDETYRDEREIGFGSFMRVYERDPVRIRIVYNGKEREWFAQLNTRTWSPDDFGEVWVVLPPRIQLSL